MENVTNNYKKFTAKKILFGIILSIVLILLIIYALCSGDYPLTISQIISALLGNESGPVNLVIWNIRIPRILAAIICGIALSTAGAVMQCTLKNPLASPFTLGVSQGAMFGACLAIVFFGVGSSTSAGKISVISHYPITVFAFLGSLLGVAAILLISRLKNLAPEALVLAGVAVSSLFTAGTTLLQYFADSIQLAAMVYWSFGDLGRPLWPEVKIMAVVTTISLIYFIYKRWDYNALESGEETAKSLGVHTDRVRIMGMLFSSLVTSVCVAFLGIIGFVGLICPHIVRITVGGDYRHLIPLCALFGAILVLAADTFARTIISPIVLPVGILTSFLGAPMFLYLLMKMYKK
ncbi:transport system permease protein [Methanococcus vannielii SB]|jgi:iron complex transport system permease protein|uniref:Transport system permease protein n=1 Tax=Methanococcus vannielii (strain ATCC 35089 / DSM 1224 / JCM 13029 / OCM 148 / SB) TaxID=406327 RepID=A6UPI3_METVS|nr:iron ABC transporter permease [Methanococcus vannielii]ABR54405.1 transport system permease protein [Methanococcus vannielii SB]